MSVLRSARDALLPLMVCCALGAVGFGAGVGTVAIELFWIAYAVMRVLSLVFVTVWIRRPSETTARGPDPLYALQQRYASGELTDAEFEASLDRLLGDHRLSRVRERVAELER